MRERYTDLSHWDFIWNALRDKKTTTLGEPNFLFAPEKAAYVEFQIEAEYIGDVVDPVTGLKTGETEPRLMDITYTVHLGLNSSETAVLPESTKLVLNPDNYSLVNNTSYVYTIRIEDDYTLVVEAAEEGEGSSENAPGSHGDIYRTQSNGRRISWSV